MKSKPSLSLADVIRLDARLATWCPRCQRPVRYLDPRDLAREYGEVTRLSVIGRRMVCSRCGERGAGLRLAQRENPFETLTHKTALSVPAVPQLASMQTPTTRPAKSQTDPKWT
jgi:hypothetical protein